MSKLLSQLLWFCIATLCDWLKLVFSRAWRRLHVHVIASSSDWFIGLSASVVIGQSDYFEFGFTTLSTNRFKTAQVYLLMWLIWSYHKQGICSIHKHPKRMIFYITLTGPKNAVLFINYATLKNTILYTDICHCLWILINIAAVFYSAKEFSYSTSLNHIENRLKKPSTSWSSQSN